MLTLISTIGGYIVALFPRLFDMWQDRADKKHELDILHMQMRRQTSVFELVLINLLTMLWIFVHGDKVSSVGELIQIMEIVFDADEMALLGTIIAMWFGSRGNSKAGK
jgi:hypothetical protein